MDPRDRDDVSRSAARFNAPLSSRQAGGAYVSPGAGRPRPRLGFIGAGRVGSAMARCLASAGYPVAAVASRSRDSAERLAGAVSGFGVSSRPEARAEGSAERCRALADAQAVADTTDLVFITTPDDVIASVAGSVRWRPGQWVVHASGGESVEALSAARAAGALVGSIHPLQAFADVEQAMARLPGSTFALEGEGPLLDCLKEMVRALGGQWLVLRAEEKALYHAAAVLASNYVVALAGAAADLWRLLGVERSEALRALLPLLRGTLENLGAFGLPQALTGPVARGDAGTVARHLSALARRSPRVWRAYRELALLTIPLALDRGGLDEEGAAGLRSLLEGPVESPSPPTPEEVPQV